MCMRGLATAVVAAVLAGCGPEPAEFADEYPEAVCAWVAECSWSAAEDESGIEDQGPGVAEGASLEGCAAQVDRILEQAEADDACAYDAGQARQCLAALEGPCDERTAVYYECKRVYSGDECEVELSLSQ